MRIGAFAKKNDISVETIRYYMELGLIVPVKKGGHYDFSGNCQKNLDKVKSFKSMGFTLQEIRKVFQFSALSRLHSTEEKAYYLSYFRNNLARIEAEMQRLISAKALVEGTLNDMDYSETKPQSIIGVPLNALPLLCCPSCKSDLMLKSGRVAENKIIEGELGCGCGMVYRIDDGILEIDPIHIDMDFSDDMDMRVEYFESTSDEYIEKIYIAGRWMENVLLDFSEPKVILEPGIGSGYALGQGMNSIPQGSLYFAVDHNLNRLKEIRDYFSRSVLGFDLVLIGADFLSTPLKNKCVDVVLDMSGSSNRAFDSSEFLLKEMNHFVKDDASLYGLYIMADGIDPNAIPFENHRLFHLESVKEELNDLGFDILSDNETGKVTEGGPHEGFVEFVKSTWTYCCYAKR